MTPRRTPSANLVLSLVLLGCGVTPDAASQAAQGGTAGVANGPDAGVESGADAGTPPLQFDCTTSSQPAEMVAVPATTFAMGCSATDTACKADEMPLHDVALSAFEIDQTEVTQDEYTACVLAEVCAAPSCGWDCGERTHPAHCITRADAVTYCAWAEKRLPTEAEWEGASRGSDGRIYPWGDQDPDCALVNMAGCGNAAEAVGTHPDGASPFGALDMAGNVVEIVSDWYDADFYAASPAADPAGPASGTRYVGRGGGFRSEPVWQRTSARDVYDLSDASTPIGFRCAR